MEIVKGLEMFNEIISASINSFAANEISGA